MPTAPIPPITPEDLRAAAAAKVELGDAYDDVLAASLLERLDAQLLERRGRRSASVVDDAVTVIVALGSIGLGVTFALAAQHLGDVGGTLATIVAWVAIAAVNFVHARAREGG